MIEQSVQGTSIPFRIAEKGDVHSCCGCHLTLRMDEGDAEVCDCRCHDTAKFIAGKR
jgi:hypothetical protein